MTIELYYGRFGKDDDGHGFFLNDKERLPIIIKPGKRVKKTYKSGNTTLKLEAACDKNDLGGAVEADYSRVDKRLPHPIDPLFREVLEGGFWKGTDTVGLGQTITRMIEPNIGYRIRHTSNLQ